MWLIDESVRRHKNKMARVIEVFPGADGVIRSPSIKTADGVIRSPAVKLAPVLYECFPDENGAGDVGAKDSKNSHIFRRQRLEKLSYLWNFDAKDSKNSHIFGISWKVL